MQILCFSQVSPLIEHLLMGLACHCDCCVLMMILYFPSSFYIVWNSSVRKICLFPLYFIILLVLLRLYFPILLGLFTHYLFVFIFLVIYISMGLWIFFGVVIQCFPNLFLLFYLLFYCLKCSSFGSCVLLMFPKVFCCWFFLIKHYLSLSDTLDSSCILPVQALE